MNAIDNTRIEMIEKSISEDAKIGRLYSDDLLWGLFENACSAIADTLKKINPELDKLVDDTMMLQRTIDAKDNGDLNDREAENLIYLVPELSHLVEVFNTK